MKFLVVVRPPSIYHGCSTWKTFWEEKFTDKKHVFLAANMKSCDCHNVSMETVETTKPGTLAKVFHELISP